MIIISWDLRTSKNTSNYANKSLNYFTVGHSWIPVWSALSANIVASNGECFVMFHNVLRVFHDVLRVFHDVLRVFHVLLVVYDVLWHFMLYHNVLQVFHDVLLCFTMFSESRNDWHRRPHGRLRDCDKASGIVIMPQGSSITPPKSAIIPQGLSISPRKWSHAKLRPEWRLE